MPPAQQDRKTKTSKSFKQTSINRSPFRARWREGRRQVDNNPECLTLSPLNHNVSPSGTLFVEFQDVKNSGEFFSKINAQCKKDGLGRHTVKSSLYSAYVQMVNRDLQDNPIQDTVKLVRDGVTKELENFR